MGGLPAGPGSLATRPYHVGRRPYTACSDGPFHLGLTLSVGRQPVALVVDGHGPQTAIMANIFTSDREAYAVRETDLSTAAGMLASQQVAAVIVIPSTFESDVATGTANVDLTLNNVDVDFGDDIRAGGQVGGPI